MLPTPGYTGIWTRVTLVGGECSNHYGCSIADLPPLPGSWSWAFYFPVLTYMFHNSVKKYSMTWKSLKMIHLSAMNTLHNPAVQRYRGRTIYSDGLSNKIKWLRPTKQIVTQVNLWHCSVTFWSNTGLLPRRHYSTAGKSAFWKDFLWRWGCPAEKARMAAFRETEVRCDGGPEVWCCPYSDVLPN